MLVKKMRTYKLYTIRKYTIIRDIYIQICEKCINALTLLGISAIINSRYRTETTGCSETTSRNR